MKRHPARDLEEALADAWPAAESEDLEGWLLRASGGPSKHGNSVATYEASLSDLSLEARIDKAETWYAQHGQPALFHVGPCAAPAELDQELSSRGYARIQETLVMTAEPRAVAALKVKRAKLEASLGFSASPAFKKLLTESRFAGFEDTLLGVLQRLGTRCRYVVLRDTQGTPLGCAVGITSEDRLGIYEVFTKEAARCTGVGRALLQALGQSALAESMRELYVAVEIENSPAVALFEQAGFREFYRYHYRERSVSGGVADA